eukprot:3555661-Rhodomonas_salina.2
MAEFRMCGTDVGSGANDAYKRPVQTARYRRGIRYTSRGTERRGRGTGREGRTASSRPAAAVPRQG